VRREPTHTVISHLAALIHDMSSGSSLPPPLSTPTKSIRELVESSDYPTYPSPPHEPRGIAMHHARGGTVLPSTTLISSLALLLAFFLIVMALIFFAERNPVIGCAFTAGFAAVAYELHRLNR